MEVGEGLVDFLNHLPEENENFTSIKNIVTGKYIMHMIVSYINITF